MTEERVQSNILVPVEEYLSTAYSPDVDYVDGHLVERNVGEYYHSLLQGLVVTYFNANLRARYGAKFRAFPEYRMEVRQRTRFRVPDVSVLAAGHPKTPYMEVPPVISIEILSPDDEYGQTPARCLEYVRRGCENVWLLDPRERTLAIVELAGYRLQKNRVVEFTLNGESIQVDFNEIFAEMNQD